MKRLSLAPLFCVVTIIGAGAQQAEVVDSCNALPASLAVGQPWKLYQDKGGRLCVSPGLAGSIYRNLDLGTTGQVVKNAPGQMGVASITNQAGSVRYIKLYDKATAPTSSDTPVFTQPLPAGNVVSLNLTGVSFQAGIALRATTAIADNDTGAPAANDVVVNLLFK